MLQLLPSWPMNHACRQQLLHGPLLNAVMPSETPKRRRGRPCANPIGEAASWTAEMIEILLERKTTFTRAIVDARNNDAVQLGWNRLALSVNTILHANFSSEQINDKYANRKTLYRKNQRGRE